MLNLQKFFQLNRAEIALADINNFQNQPADALDILLDKSLLQIEQFQLTAEKNLSEEEQIVWHINSVLPKPIEEYYYAYQIYLQEEGQLQGLFCVTEKDALANVTSIRNQQIRIYSADKQFLLYENKIPLWQIDTYLTRMQNLAKIICIASSILLILFAPPLFLLQRNFSARNNKLLAEKEILASQIKIIRDYERQQKTAQKNQLLNKNLSKYFSVFSLNIPENVYFTNLNYQEQQLKIDGFCALDKELKALQKALKTETALKPELAKLQKTDRLNFTLQVDLQKILEKEA